MSTENLFQALRQGEKEKFISLLTNYNINVQNQYGQNLIQELISSGQNSLLDELLDRNIDLNSVDEKGLTALHYCGIYRNGIVAKKILSLGANLDAVDPHGNQPLWTAVFNARGNYEVVKVLAENRANQNHKNKAGRSPLDFAKQIKDEQIIKLLDY